MIRLVFDGGRTFETGQTVVVETDAPGTQSYRRAARTARVVGASIDQHGARNEYLEVVHLDDFTYEGYTLDVVKDAP